MYFATTISSVRRPRGMSIFLQITKFLLCSDIFEVPSLLHFDINFLKYSYAPK